MSTANSEVDAGVVLAPIPAPTLIDAVPWTYTPASLGLTPEQILSIYDDKQWEEFILEWCTTLSHYEKVMRSGGSNDHGVDVAAFRTARGFDGDWDCYQCKHYSSALAPNEAYPEILKVVLGVMDGLYTWPKRYLFAAPKGSGTTLARSLNSAELLRKELQTSLTETDSKLARKIGKRPLQPVLDFIAAADFSGFSSLELHELVEGHRTTRWHTARFGTQLPDRTPARHPAPTPLAGEQKYIDELLLAYDERHGSSLTHAAAMASKTVQDHYHRQRVAFYSAEALRVFARESVPEGTFLHLQDQFYDGVIAMHDESSGDGLSRLHDVVDTAQKLSITSSGLLPVLYPKDRTGICHQLVNSSRLRWVR